MDDFDTFDDLGRWEQVRVYDEERFARRVLEQVKALSDEEDDFQREVRAAERGLKYAPKR